MILMTTRMKAPQGMALRSCGVSLEILTPKEVEMAIFHFSVLAVRRSTGDSVVKAVANMHAIVLTDHHTCLTHDCRARGPAAASCILLPAGVSAAPWMLDRGELWNRAEHAERRTNSRVGRMLIIALPAELAQDAREALARRMAQHVADRYRIVVDLAIRVPSSGGDPRNHHAIAMLSTRRVEEQGYGEKVRELDDRRGPGEVLHLRAIWAEFANHALAQAGRPERIDHRSLKDQGINKAATSHLGPIATAIERRGEASGIGDHNRAVMRMNDEYAQLLQEQEAIEAELATLKALPAAAGGNGHGR